jgi:hypothetical protein
MRQAGWFGAAQRGGQVGDGGLEVEMGTAAAQEVQHVIAHGGLFGRGHGVRPHLLPNAATSSFEGVVDRHLLAVNNRHCTEITPPPVWHAQVSRV